MKSRPTYPNSPKGRTVTGSYPRETQSKRRKGRNTGGWSHAHALTSYRSIVSSSHHHHRQLQRDPVSQSRSIHRRVSSCSGGNLHRSGLVPPSISSSRRTITTNVNITPHNPSSGDAVPTTPIEPLAPHDAPTTGTTAHIQSPLSREQLIRSMSHHHKKQSSASETRIEDDGAVSREPLSSPDSIPMVRIRPTLSHITSLTRHLFDRSSSPVSPPTPSPTPTPSPSLSPPPTSLSPPPTSPQQEEQHHHTRHQHPHSPPRTPPRPPFTPVEQSLFLPIINTTKFYSLSNTRQLLRRIGFNLFAVTSYPFFPDRFPRSLIRPRDYTMYSIYQFLSNIAGAAGSVVSMQAMLLSVGLTAIQATPAAAALTWILKDLFGQIGGSLLAAHISQQRENQPRLQRYRSTVIFMVASLMELSTMLRPSALLFIGTIATLLKNLSWIWSASSKARTHLTFVTANHITDITAKSAAQSTAAGVIGTSLGAFSSYLLTSRGTSSSSSSSTSSSSSSLSAASSGTSTETRASDPSPLKATVPETPLHTTASEDHIIANTKTKTSSIISSQTPEALDAPTAKVTDTMATQPPSPQELESLLTDLSSQVSSLSQFQLQVGLFLVLSSVSLYFTVKSLRYVHLNTFDLQRAVLFTNTACTHVIQHATKYQRGVSPHTSTPPVKPTPIVTATATPTANTSNSSGGTTSPRTRSPLVVPECSPDSISLQEDFLFHYRQPYVDYARLDFGLLTDQPAFKKAIASSDKEADKMVQEYLLSDRSSSSHPDALNEATPAISVGHQSKHPIPPRMRRYLDQYTPDRLLTSFSITDDLPYLMKIDHHAQFDFPNPALSTLYRHSQSFLHRFTGSLYRIRDRFDGHHRSVPSQTHDIHSPGGDPSSSVQTSQQQTSQQQTPQQQTPQQYKYTPQQQQQPPPQHSIRLIWRDATEVHDQILAIAHGLLCKHIIILNSSGNVSAGSMGGLSNNNRHAPHPIPPWSPLHNSPGSPLESAIHQFVRDNIHHVPRAYHGITTGAPQDHSRVALERNGDEQGIKTTHESGSNDSSTDLAIDNPEIFLLQSKYLLYHHPIQLSTNNAGGINGSVALPSESSSSSSSSLPPQPSSLSAVTLKDIILSNIDAHQWDTAEFLDRSVPFNVIDPHSHSPPH